MSRFKYACISIFLAGSTSIVAFVPTSLFSSHQESISGNNDAGARKIVYRTLVEGLWKPHVRRRLESFAANVQFDTNSARYSTQNRREDRSFLFCPPLLQWTANMAYHLAVRSAGICIRMLSTLRPLFSARE